MKIIVAAFLLLTLGACAAGAGGNRNASLASAPGDDSFLLSGLSQPALPPGKCGMILWTLDEKAPTPIFSYVAGEPATIAVNGAPISLTLAETAGGGEYGVFERQQFVGGAGYDALVTVNFGLGFDGGTYLERGLVSVNSRNGWSLVAPVAGIAGCRSK